MIFQYSVGTSGVSDELYSIHVPLVFCAGKVFAIKDEIFKQEFDGLEFRIQKHHYLYSLNVSSFNSHEDAQLALDKILSALRWASLKNKVGIKFPLIAEVPNLYMEPLLVSEKSYITQNAGWTHIDGDFDTERLTILPEHRRLTRWEAGQVTITIGLNPQTFLQDLQQCLQFHSISAISANKKLCLAIDLYATHSFEVILTSKFLKLVTALESLLPDYEISEEAKRQLDNSKAVLKEHRKEMKEGGEDTSSIDHLICRMGGLSKQSIGFSIESFVSDCIEEFPGLGITNEILPKLKKAYNVRSKLLHDGTFDEEELGEYVQLLSDALPKLLTEMFIKYANTESG